MNTEEYVNFSQYVMTADKLRMEFNEKFALGNWPEKVLVNAETYANVCQYIFDHIACRVDDEYYEIALGPNRGLMFKNVELILRK